jgi:hypothetical protein
VTAGVLQIVWILPTILVFLDDDNDFLTLTTPFGARFDGTKLGGFAIDTGSLQANISLFGGKL